MPSQPVSEKQIAANRINASQSTGPRTPGGKARSAQNARKHGFTAAIFAVVRLEAGLFTTCLNEVLDPSGQPFFPMSPELVGDGDIQTTREQNRNYALAEGFQRMSKTANTWALFLRYQAQSERLYRRAVAGRTWRGAMPCEEVFSLSSPWCSPRLPVGFHFRIAHPNKCPPHHLLYNEIRGKRSDTEARRRPAERCPA